MIDWQKQAAATIEMVDRNLPPEADLAERRKALRAAKPYEFSATSWGNKVWAKHCRKYLEKHGLPPLKPSVVKHLSPLERLMERSRHEQ